MLNFGFLQCSEMKSLWGPIWTGDDLILSWRTSPKLLDLPALKRPGRYLTPDWGSSKVGWPGGSARTRPAVSSDRSG
jgi:hypothetical protein